MTEEITTQPGDTIEIIGGEFKGEKGTIIGVYKNSSSIELVLKEKNNKPRKTVVAHSQYKVLS